MDCPQCGFANTAQATVCARCGTQLRPAAPGPNPGYGYTTPPAAQPPAPGPTGYGYSTPPAATPPANYSYSTPPADTPSDYSYSTPPAATPPSPYSPPPEMARGPGEMAPVAAPPRKSNMLRNVVLAVALLAVVGVGVVGYLAFQTVNKPNVPVAKLLPPEVYGYLSFAATPKGDQKAALDKLEATFKSQPGFQKAWDKLTAMSGAMNGGSGLPGLGECATPGAATSTPSAAGSELLASYLGNNISVALLPLSLDELDKLQQNDSDTNNKILSSKFLAFVDLDFNPLNKKGLLPLIKQQSDNPNTMPLAETYRGVEIRKLVQKPCAGVESKVPTIYVALIEGTGVIGLDPAPFHEAVDRYKDGKSLQDNPAFAKLDSELPKDRISTFYLNLTSLYKTIEVVAAQMSTSQSTPIKMAHTEGAALIAVSAHDDGIQVDGVSNTTVDGQALGSTAVPGAGWLDDVPAGSWGFYGGTDLKTTVEQALALIRKQGQGDMVDGTLKSVNDNMGIDVEKDLLPLLGGDYAFSVTNTRDLTAPTPTPDPNQFFSESSGPDIHFAVEVQMKAGEGAKMDNLIKTMNTHLADQGATPQQIPVGQASLWQIDPSFPYLYGVTGDKLFIANGTSEDPTGWPSKVLGGQGKGMGTDAAFKARIARLPKSSNTLLYLDLTKIRTDLEPMMGADAVMQANYEEGGAPFLRPFQYLIGGSNASVKDGMTHGRSVLFLGIGK